MGIFRSLYKAVARKAASAKRSAAHSLPGPIRQRIAAAGMAGKALQARHDGDEELAASRGRMVKRYLTGTGRVPKYERSGWEK